MAVKMGERLIVDEQSNIFLSPITETQTSLAERLNCRRFANSFAKREGLIIVLHYTVLVVLAKLSLPWSLRIVIGQTMTTYSGLGQMTSIH